MEEFTVGVEQSRKFHAIPLRADGVTPARVDGTPVWTATAPTDGAPASPMSVALVPDADGLGCNVLGTMGAGDFDLTVEADADLGQGVRSVSDTVRIHVKEAEATAITMTADDPVPL